MERLLLRTKKKKEPHLIDAKNVKIRIFFANDVCLQINFIINCLILKKKKKRFRIKKKYTKTFKKIIHLRKKYRRFTKKIKYRKSLKSFLLKYNKKEARFIMFNQNRNQKQIYLEPKINWISQKLVSRLMRGGNKYQMEKKLFEVYKKGSAKKKRLYFSKNFFLQFFEKVKKYRPRIEVSKKKRKKGKTSALAKERMRRTKVNRFLVPNCMSRQKQMQTVLVWIIDEIKTTGLRKPKVQKVELRDPAKKIRPKNEVKGRKNLLLAIKAAKKRRQLEKLQIKEKIVFKVYPIKRKLKKILIDIFLVKKQKSLLFKKLNLYVEILGIQANVPGLRRWK